MKFLVYQRRLYLKALETKALLMAAINPEKADGVAQLFFELTLPVDPDTKKLEEYKKDMLIKEVEQMGPIPLSSIRIGMPMNDAYISETTK